MKGRFSHLPGPNDLPEIFTVGGKLIPFADVLNIDSEDLSAEYETHAAWQASIGFAHAYAARDLQKAESDLNRLKARMYFLKRRELEAGGGKPTVDAIAAAVATDQEVMDAEDRASELKYKERILDSAVRSMNSRKEMIISLGAHERAELKNM